MKTPAWLPFALICISTIPVHVNAASKGVLSIGKNSPKLAAFAPIEPIKEIKGKLTSDLKAGPGRERLSWNKKCSDWLKAHRKDTHAIFFACGMPKCEPGKCESETLYRYRDGKRLSLPTPPVRMPNQNSKAKE